jgi:hypothetical protein
MSEPLPPPLPGTLCAFCHKDIGAENSYCPHCGKRQGSGDAWYYSVVSVAFLAFFVIGPFALPLVWKSSRMGATTKYVLTALILVYAAITAYALYAVTTSSLKHFEQILEINEVWDRRR